MSMLQKLTAVQMERIAPLFSGNNETLITSCLQGEMGTAWVDDADRPRCSRIITGAFCFFGGDGNHPYASRMVSDLPEGLPPPLLLLIPPDEVWAKLIELHYQGSCQKYFRYALKKRPECFDQEKLFQLSQQLPSEYELCRIGQPIYDLCLREEWSYDFCSQFSNFSDYNRRGLGFAVLHQGQLVSAASSYTVYREGIEIEIGTREGYRNQGLATACAAALILECIGHQRYPSWDAANQASLALAQKLGYQFSHEYLTYEIPIEPK